MRGLILNASERCAACHLPPRWCVCPAHAAVRLPLAVDVVMHHREAYRPSSTGHLIGRVVEGARTHPWRKDRPVPVDEVRVPGREAWILHPNGAPPPPSMTPGSVQVILIDGSWREASAIAHGMQGWGRLVGLPMTGESRFWLRTQGEPGRFSTFESLLWLLGHFGLVEEEAALRLQFELHVYAGLKSRGRKDEAARYLAGSPITGPFAGLLAAFEVRRPR